MLMSDEEEYSWQKVLAQTRAVNASPRGRYNLCMYWRARAYPDDASIPEPIVRARAFASVLEHVPIHRYDGERFAGSGAGFTSDALPSGITEEAYAQAQARHEARGQRNFSTGFDHAAPDYASLLAEGVGGLIARVEASMSRHTDANASASLQAMEITLQAFEHFIRRHAAECPGHEAELAHISSHPPRTLAEAMQLLWLLFIAFSSEGRHHMAFGRIDQYLYPFYQRDLAAGILDEDGALDLFCHFWARIEEFGEVTNICIGGLTPDGADATNDLSYLCLEATRLVQSPHTNLSARFHDGTPEQFHRACYECIRTGVGFPAIFNDHVLVPGLIAAGIPAEVTRDYCMVGCIETMLSGRQPAWGDSRFNAALCLESALESMSKDGERSYARLYELFQESAREMAAVQTAEINRRISEQPADRFPDPFLSALTRDCIGRALDVNGGGAEFPRFFGLGVMGLGTISDSLAAVKKLVFEEHALSYDQLMDALRADFNRHGPVRQLLQHRAPKYGNDDPYVDDIAAGLVKFFATIFDPFPLTGGGRFVSLMAANLQNIAAGKEVGATPDGRLAHTPLSDAASPSFGCDLHGPTAFLRSVARPDFQDAIGGNVINMKFDPSFFEGDEGAACFSAFTHAFVRRRIPELQFNFTSNKTLLDALEHPESYGSLVVRVSGFSAYFTRLDAEAQHDIIRRRAHGG